MKSIFEENKRDLEKNILDIFDSYTDLTEIRTNLSAIYSIKKNNHTFIIKCLIVKGTDHDSFDDYLNAHFYSVLKLSKLYAFPSIYEYKFIEINGYTFAVILEEFLPITFQEGTYSIHAGNDYNIKKTIVHFLNELIDIYLDNESEGFLAHRDLSFDNIRYNDKLLLKMIDTSSAKNSDFETTVFKQVTPTKSFYAAPEYFDISDNKTKEGIISAEIYTIGLITLSLIGALKSNLFKSKNMFGQGCGIVNWLSINKESVNFQINLSQYHKKGYLNFLLIEVFDGEKNDLLFRLLQAMTEESVSQRISKYNKVKEILGKVGI